MFDYQFINEVKCLREKVEKLYIYGAGFRGKDIYRILKRHDVKIDGFVVTEISESEIKEGLPVLKASFTLKNKNVGYVLGLSDINTIDVVEYLKEQNTDFSKIIDGGKYLSEYRGIKDLRNEPFLEVTTVIGCRVNCRFCPQNLLVGRYFEKNKQRKRVMSLDDFKQILSNTPENCVIMFAGMAEPYLNPDCTKMLQLACDMGRKVRLYTTLEGAKEEDIDAILKMPLEFIGLHIADKNNYAKIKTSENYYKMVEKLSNAKKINSESSFLDDITSQGTPDEKIVEILKDRFEIITAVQDRAGNLEDDETEKRNGRLEHNDKFVCTYCGSKANNHVVLPDGTLLLCQMDYGMKHVLGNILEQSYDELRKESTMTSILEAMEGNHNCDLLCTTCLYSKVLNN